MDYKQPSMPLSLPSHKDFLLEVVEVLARRGARAAELDALREALPRVTDPRATWDFLLRRAPRNVATLSPVDGTVGLEGNAWFVVNDAGDTVARFRAKVQRCTLPEGTRVRAGERLSDGEVDPGNYVDLHGVNGARPMLLAMLREASGLDDALLGLLLEPMLDAVEVDPTCFYENPLLPPGAVMTRRRFDHECARALRRALVHRRESASAEEHATMSALLALDARALLDAVRALPQGPGWSEYLLTEAPAGKPVLAGYGTLLAMDPQGFALDTGRVIDLGTFEVCKGTLSVSTPERLRRHPERDVAQAAQQAFGARKGTWRALAHAPRAWQSDEALYGLRVWHSAHEPRFDRWELAPQVSLTSDVMVLTDLTKSVAAAAREGSLAKTVAAHLDGVAGSRAVALAPGGWACAPGAGVYPLCVEYGSEGLAVALAVDFRRRQ